MSYVDVSGARVGTRWWYFSFVCRRSERKAAVAAGTSPLFQMRLVLHLLVRWQANCATS